jgi:hypothetical protein
MPSNPMTAAFTEVETTETARAFKMQPIGFFIKFLSQVAPGSCALRRPASMPPSDPVAEAHSCTQVRLSAPEIQCQRPLMQNATDRSRPIADGWEAFPFRLRLAGASLDLSCS